MILIPVTLIVSPTASELEAELSEFLYKKCFPSVLSSWRQTSWWIQQTLKIRGTVELLGENIFLFFSNIIIIFPIVLPAQHVLLLNRSLFSNFSIDNILSERLAEEENVKIVDVNVLTKIKQEKIELLGESLLMK